MAGSGVLVAAGDRFVGESIISILEKIKKGHEHILLHDGMEAFEYIQDHNPEFSILDLFLPRLNGIAILSEMKKAAIKTSVLCYCRRLRPTDGVRAVKAGAGGILDLSFGVTDFEKTIREVQNGRRFIPGHIKKLITERDFEMFPEKYRGITTRQVQVMQMTAEGFSNKEVAFHLNISIKTVEKHKRNLRDKLGLFSSLEIGLFALREGLVEMKEGECS